MSKFAKKMIGDKVSAKLKTNDPELQNQDTGEVTAKGKAKLKVVKSKAKGNPDALKKARAARAEKSSEPDTRKITLVTKENPKREGSDAFKRFELYKKAKTAQAFFDAGGTSADLRYDEKAGHIKVA